MPLLRRLHCRLPRRLVRRIGLAAAALVALTVAIPGLAPAALAQGAWPARPVRLIVPFAPGGATDLIGRLMAQKLSEGFNQQFVVENRGGAGSTLGTDVAAKATPDGYTIVMAANTSMGTASLLYPALPYRPLEDFAQVALIGTFPNAFVVNANHPARTLAAFLEMAKSKAGGLTYGSAGPGSAGHLTGELLRARSGATLLHIPYKGTGPATADLLAGNIDALFDGMPTATQQARSGRVRVLAVTGRERVPTFPDVPTMNEVVPGVIGTAWFGIAAPARTPASVVETLQGELLKILRMPDVVARLNDIGMTPQPLGAADFTAFIRSEIEKWTPVVRQSGIKVE